MPAQLLTYGILIFGVALLAGFIAITSVKIHKGFLNLFLAFSGAYLFSITVVHILPELFEYSEDITVAGIYVLAGFFLQQILEYFSSGVEHGHLHEPGKDHKHTIGFIFSVVAALTIHSLLEGTVLTDQHGESIFLGVLIHKAPAAFALVSIVMCHIKSRRVIFFSLLIFSLASPIGMVISYLFSENSIHTILLGLVSGSFLQISTTIVFESSVEHKFNLWKLIISFAGAGLAILSELLLLN